MTDTHAQRALRFLRDQLGTRAPATLGASVFFPGEPLEGERDMTVFSFEASLEGGQAERFWVVAGDTTPNYYPHWGLTPDDAYSVHLGTRFMLVLEAAQVPTAEWPTDLVPRVREALEGALPGQDVSAIEPRVVFRVGDELHAVCQAVVGAASVNVLAYDAPLGVYPVTDLPAHVLYRKHLGSLIRSEAQREARDAQKLRG